MVLHFKKKYVRTMNLRLVCFSPPYQKKTKKNSDRLLSLTDCYHPTFRPKKSEVDSANASGTQALTLRGLSNPGVMCMGVVYREAVSRYTVITPP